MGVVGVVGAVDVASQPLPSLRLVPHAAKHVASIESCRHGHRHRQVMPKLQDGVQMAAFKDQSRSKYQKKKKRKHEKNTK